MCGSKDPINVLAPDWETTSEVNEETSTEADATTKVESEVVSGSTEVDGTVPDSIRDSRRTLQPLTKLRDCALEQLQLSSQPSDGAFRLAVGGDEAGDSVYEVCYSGRYCHRGADKAGDADWVHVDVSVWNED
ncbi:hypothetical protein MRS44_004072 [Fusarium solani]|uniref:uncharacterized protein n=1 Tax=Fusarium solani TaxID=169388 RepID=UPI0032C3F89A|nr:hypothetical protein MRS44_004072 [Fusarium solani]